MIHARPLNLNTVVSDMTSVLRRVVTERIELITELSPTLWAVLGDASQLEQVLLNLLANARDAMPNGGRVVIASRNATLTTGELQAKPDRKPGDYVVLSVRDTGVGIDEEVREHIFEPFFTTKSRGTGLGLASCYGIIKQLGGYIDVTSAAAGGTTFEAYLPRSTEHPTASSQRRTAVERGHETVLIAEDDDAVRRTQEHALAAAGYTVLAARDGQHALELASEYRGKLALVVTDMVMPRLSGRQLAERLTAIRPDVQVLFVSGYLDQIALPDHVLGSPAHFLAKPYAIEDLLRTVRELIDSG